MKLRTLQFSAFAAFAALACAPASSYAQSILKTAGNFTILGGQDVTSALVIPGLVISNGNVGSQTSVTGFPPATVGAGFSIITPGGANTAILSTAMNDLITARTGLSAMAVTTDLTATPTLGGRTLTPGVYKFGVAADLTGTLTLDAQGKNGVVWVFNIGTSLTTAANAQVLFVNLGTNGGSDNGVFWNAGAGITFGATNIIAGNYLAGTSIAFGTTVPATGSGSGRALALAGVTFDGSGTMDALGGPGGGDMSGGLVLSGANVLYTQTITFAALTAKTFGNAAFTVSATASSGLTVAFSILSGPATITGSTVTITGAGTVTVRASQAGNSTYSAAANVDRPFTVNKATPTITTAPTASAIIFLQALSSSSLSGGVGSVAGSFAFTAPATVPGNAGTAVAGFTFTPTDATDYNSVTGSVNVTVNKATPTITTAPTASAILLGQALSSSTLSGGVGSVAGAFAFTSPATVPGSIGTAAAGFTFTPTDTTDYNSATGTVNVTVNPIVLSTVLAVPSITLTAGVAATAFSPVTYSGGTGAVSFSIVSGTLPPGLTISAAGVITGTPLVPVVPTSLTITATDSASSPATSSKTFTLAVSDPAPYSRIVNFSSRALSGPGNQTLIVGFVTTGASKNLLVRGVGPGLTALGISNVMADPVLTVYNASGTAAATNNDWQTTSGGVDQTSLVQAADTQVGAFALSLGSKDSALFLTVGAGSHTTNMLSPSSTTGVALTEIYDLDALTSSSRLINVSARMNVTSGDGALIAGFVIAGTSPKTVLIRAAGPALATFGVTGLLADPSIAIYSTSHAVVASDDNWETGSSTAAQISSMAAQVGAFPFATGGKDAAVLVSLQPGAYTVIVSGVGAATGVALIEVYDTQWYLAQ